MSPPDDRKAFWDRRRAELGGGRMEQVEDQAHKGVGAVADAATESYTPSWSTETDRSLLSSVHTKQQA